MIRTIQDSGVVQFRQLSRQALADLLEAADNPDFQEEGQQRVERERRVQRLEDEMPSTQPGWPRCKMRNILRGLVHGPTLDREHTET